MLVDAIPFTATCPQYSAFRIFSNAKVKLTKSNNPKRATAPMIKVILIMRYLVKFFFANDLTFSFAIFCATAISFICYFPQ